MTDPDSIDRSSDPVAGEHTALIHHSMCSGKTSSIEYIKIPKGWTVQGESMTAKGEYLEYKFTLIPPPS